jgi:hypothetical protein
MRRLSREEFLRESGAPQELLNELEVRGVLVPTRRWRLFNRIGGPLEYYTDGQLEALRLIMKERNAVAASSR